MSWSAAASDGENAIAHIIAARMRDDMLGGDWVPAVGVRGHRSRRRIEYLGRDHDSPSLGHSLSRKSGRPSRSVPFPSIVLNGDVTVRATQTGGTDRHTT